MYPDTKLSLLIVAFALIIIAVGSFCAYVLKNIIVDCARNKKFDGWNKSIGEVIHSRTSIFCFFEMMFGLMPLALANSIAECKVDYYHLEWNQTPFLVTNGLLPFILLLYSIGISERKNNVTLTINSIFFILLFTTQVVSLFLSILSVIFPEYFVQ